MNMKHIIQIIFTVIVVCTVIVTMIKVIKKNDKTTYKSEGMMIGVAIGCISSYYILNALICAPIGMFLGIEIGEKYKKK